MRHERSSRARSVGLVLALLAGVSPGLAPAQVVRGVVVDSTSKVPLADAMVSLVDSTGVLIGSVRSNRAGRFTLDASGNRYFAVHTRHVGFEPKVSGWVEGAPSDTFEVTVRLPRFAVTLSPVVVKAETDSLREFGSVLGMKLGTFSGQLLTPSQITNAVGGSRDYLDLLQSLAVVGFFAKCLDRSCVDRCYASMRTGGCVTVFVDDVRTQSQNAVDLAPPSMIHHALVLRGLEAGVLFGGDSENGVLLLYTRARMRPRH